MPSAVAERKRHTAPTVSALEISGNFRPQSIAEVARRRVAFPLHPLWKPVCEFLDNFYEFDCSDCRRSMLTEEPTPVLVGNEAAYLAGVTEHLSIYYGLAMPDWVHKPSYFLRQPYFPGPFRSKLVDAMCAVESPYAFRRRLVFVENEPLRRKLGPRSGYEALRSLLA